MYLRGYEDNRFMGFGSEIAAEMSEKYFDLLDAPVTRVAGADTHIPYSPTLEEEVLPQVKDVVNKVLQLISY